MNIAPTSLEKGIRDIRICDTFLCQPARNKGNTLVLQRKIGKKAALILFVALGPAAAGAEGEQISYLSCQVCHGAAGTGSSIPTLQGRPYDELLTLLTSFATGTAQTTIMHRFMVGTTDADREGLARYISQGEGDQP